jgi:hypothetical protein
MRVFLDTNGYIVGAAFPESAEAAILEWAGFDGTTPPAVEVVVSEALFEQIRAVARRVRGKDWAGEILMRLWRYMRIRFVIIDPAESTQLTQQGTIPREDVEIFLAARQGGADLFVSANRELVRAAAAQTGAFRCLSAEDFVAQYLAD